MVNWLATYTRKCNMKKVDRRKFIVSSAKGAAGLGILAGCNQRELLGPDVRPPSKPKGLEGFVDFYGNNNRRAILSWTKHDLTDILGYYSEIEIKGYSIYKYRYVLNPNSNTQEYQLISEDPINSSLVKVLTYTDESELTDNKQYGYAITAIDATDNESPKSEIYGLKVRAPSKIYKVTDPGASNNYVVNKDVVKTMFNAALLKLTEKQSVLEAYNTLFPNLSSSTKIGIKINTLAGFVTNGLSTHPELVDAIIDGLKQTALSIENIIVYDDRKESIMQGAKYTLRNDSNNYKILSTFDETDKFGNKNWSDTTITISGIVQRYSKITEDVDYIINVPVLKNHSSAGVTFALKNFFGIVNRPGDFHAPDQNPKTWCDPYIAEVYKVVADKVKLIVGDALFGAHVGGPSTTPRFLLNTLLLSTDPVALDMYALDLINTKREEDGRYKITTTPDANNPKRADARHIETADRLGLGSLNKKIIEVT